MLEAFQSTRSHILLALFYANIAHAELFYTASSARVQHGLLTTSPATCPVVQDGYTSNSFPWTHEPTCVDTTVLKDDDTSFDVHATFCTYTNANYNNGRGISFIVTPEVAASITNEAFGLGIGGLEGQVGEEMGMWEVKRTESKGQGLFAKPNIARIFAGESIIISTPMLIVAKDLLHTSSTTKTEFVLKTAIDQLPDRSKKLVKQLRGTRGNRLADVIEGNQITVKWPWTDEVPQLLALAPEVAVSSQVQHVLVMATGEL